jgi:hypothetical protein
MRHRKYGLRHGARWWPRVAFQKNRRSLRMLQTV